MWSNVRHKATFTDRKEVISELRYYILMSPVSEEKYLRGSMCQTTEFWRKRTIEEFLLNYIPEPVVKIVDISILTDDTYQIVYYLKGKLEGKRHFITPRYLLGEFGENQRLFRLIGFDLTLVDNSSEQDQEDIKEI